MRVGDGLIALTSSGALLRFELRIGQRRFPVAGSSFVVAVAKRCGDAGAGFGRKAWKGVVGQLLPVLEYEEKAANLPRMGAAMATDREMAPTAEPFDG
jgi:hypothetical protein